MKKLFFILTMLMAGVAAASAQHQTATLQKGNSTTYYYGEDAFREAYNAAADGSIITLSAGYFNTVDSVAKQITVRGNGYVDNKTEIGVTKLINVAFSLVICADNVKLEGLYLEKGVCPNQKLENLHISRCYLRSFAYYRCDSLLTNIIIDQCKVKCIRANNTINFCVKNTYLDFFYEIEDVTDIHFMNCIIGFYRPNCSYRNCIINVQNNDGHISFDGGEEYINNVFFSGIYSKGASTTVNGYGAEITIDESTRYSTPTMDVVETATIKGNTVALFDDIFNYTNEENPLYAPIITTITGDDGRVVGPYGGTGFSETPSIPRITESKIDTYTNGEGKLNVKVKVEVGQ